MFAVLKLTLVVAVCCWPLISHAQYSVPAEVALVEPSVPLRTMIQERAEHLPGWEIGASLNFLTSEPSITDTALKFTDVALLRTHVRISLAAKYELFAGTDVLIKQPSTTDELIWQGSLAGARMRIRDRWAVFGRAELGPQLARAGSWLACHGGVQYRYPLHKILFIETALGATYTRLLFDAPTGRRFWLTEVSSQVGIALRDPQAHFGTWLSFDFFFPTASSPDRDNPDPRTGGVLDPQTRVNFRLGGLIAVAERVDLFVEWSILDRGDLAAASTTLPVLNAGFDQEQILFGFMRRFDRQPAKLAAQVASPPLPPPQ